MPDWPWDSTPLPGIAIRDESSGAVVGWLLATELVCGRDDLDDWHGAIGSLQPDPPAS